MLLVADVVSIFVSTIMCYYSPEFVYWTSHSGRISGACNHRSIRIETPLLSSVVLYISRTSKTPRSQIEDLREPDFRVIFLQLSCQLVKETSIEMNCRRFWSRSCA